MDPKIDVFDKDARPHLLNKLVLTDNLARPLDKRGKEIQGAPAYPYRLSIPKQRLARRAEFKRAECQQGIGHGNPMVQLRRGSTCQCL